VWGVSAQNRGVYETEEHEGERRETDSGEGIVFGVGKKGISRWSVDCQTQGIEGQGRIEEEQGITEEDKGGGGGRG
jgi:hypothetical protein